MRILIRVAGVVVSSAGLLLLIPPALFANQRLGLVRLHWGIFDVDVDGRPVSPLEATVMLGTVGLTLIAAGILMIRGHRRSAA